MVFLGHNITTVEPNKKRPISSPCFKFRSWSSYVHSRTLPGRGGLTTPCHGVDIFFNFLAYTEIFTQNNDFHYEILAKRLRELSFLNNGVAIKLVDERSGKHDDFSGAGGVKGFVDFINKGKTVLHPNVFHAIGDRQSDQNTNIGVEVAMQWNAGYSESVHTFANTINTHEGGTHEEGFRAALTTVVNKYAKDKKLLKDKLITEDDERRSIDEVQKLTDRTVAEIDKLVQAKEAEIMAV